MACIVLLTMLSVGYAYYNLNMSAAGKGTSVLINRSGSVLGSKFVLGSFDGKDVIMEAIKDHNGSEILALGQGGDIRLGLCNTPSCNVSTVAYADTNMFIVENEINASLSTNTKAALTGGNVFLPAYNDIAAGGTFHLTSDTLKETIGPAYPASAGTQPIFQWRGIPMTKTGTEKAAWMKQEIYNVNYTGLGQAPCYAAGMGDVGTGYFANVCWSNTNKSCADSGSVQSAFIVRMAARIMKNKLAFALDTTTTGTSLTAISPSTPSDLLKLRIFDNSIGTISVNDENKSVAKGDKIKIPYSNADPSKHISVLFYNVSNQIIYYQNFSGKPAAGTLEIETASLPLGNYGIKLVNEEFTGDNQPSAVSQFSQTYNVKIVSPHSITYTKTPQSGASTGDYEFSKNVNAGQVVGKVTANPLGVTPLVYELIADGDNSYQNFEIDGLDSNNASISTPLNIKIKQNAPDLVNGGLKAGTYKFCITAVDDNGYPLDNAGNPSEKVCTSLEVKKTKPTITFDNDDQGTTYVSGSTTSTTTHSEHAIHTNTDIADNDVNIEYSFVSGNGNIISGGLPFTSANAQDQADIVFVANASGSIVIQAKIAESDNYEAASTTKTITFQLGITANYIEDKPNLIAGSTSAKPPTSYTQQNRIAHVDVSGGTAPFTYTLPSGQGDNGSFYIDASGNVYVNTSVGANGLTPGSYTIKIEVKDNTTPTKQTTTITKTINVAPATLSGVGWEDPQHSGSVLPSNTYTITYDPSSEPANGGSFHTKLKETTSGVLAGTTIQYSLIPDPNQVLTMSGTSTVSVSVKKASSASEENMVKIKAHITGGIYGSVGVDSELIVNVKKYKQSIAFADTSVLKLPVGGSCVSVPADITSTYSKSGEVIQYTTSNASPNAPFTINAQGQVCPTSNAQDAGSATLMGTLNGDDNYETATTPTGRVIQIYVPERITVSGSIIQGPTPDVTYTPDAVLKKALHTNAQPNGGTATSGSALAQVSAASSTYKKSTNNGSQNADASLFTVTPTGYITLNQNITASDLASHGTGNDYYIQVDVSDQNGNTRTVDVIIEIEDAKADFYFIDPISGTKLALSDTYGTLNVPVYKKVYEVNGTIDVNTNISAQYSEVTIAEAAGIDVAEDVIEHNGLNHFTIMNASDAGGRFSNGGDAYVKACMSAQNGYAAQCIYAKVIIEQAQQDDFAFVNQPRWTLGKSPASIQPTYNGKLSEGEVTLSSSNNTIAEVLPPVSGQDQSFQTMNKVGTATLTATAPEDRNYKAKQTTTIVETTERPPTSLTVFVPGLTYGDTGIEARITNGYKNGVPAYFYVDDTDILEVSNTPVNVRTSPPMEALGSGQVVVKVCQITVPFDPAVDDCNALGGDYGEQVMIVKKKELRLTYADEAIYVGEAFPDYRWEEPSAGAFAFNDSIHDFPIPNNTSAKKNGTAITDTNQKGTYDISGSYSPGELSGNAKHYNVLVNSGTLNIQQDIGQSSWYHLEDEQGNIVSASKWHNQNIDVVIDVGQANGNAGGYDEISDTERFSNADKSRFTVSKEDDNLKDIYFRINPNGTSAHKGAMSESVQDHIKIDKTAPKMISITGYPVNTSGLSNLLNEITLGHYFKPGVKVEMKSEDPKPANNSKAKVSGIKEIRYEVYELDANGGMVSGTPLLADSGTPGSNEVMSIELQEIGNYRVCATAIDEAGNEGTEKCSDLNIKKIDVDVDGDGKPDFNDPDGDGCADLNIKWRDSNDADKWVIINGDRDGDGIPDLNIDADGDGLAELNVDSDGDGKPDLNLVKLKKGEWKPSLCVKVDEGNGILEEYCTGTSVKAMINIDLDNDGIPDINIDTDGDMKADFNISFDGETPVLNIGKVPDEWKPGKDYTFQTFLYDTMEDLEPLYNIDTNGDGCVDTNIDLDGDEIPDLNIDIDGDGIPDVNIDGDGDGVADSNLDNDNDGIAEENVVEITVWKPETKVDQICTMMLLPDLEEEPKDEDKPNGEVGGSYYPGDNVGGALTGDTSKPLLYMGIGFSSLSILFFLLYKHKRENN